MIQLFKNIWKAEGHGEFSATKKPASFWLEHKGLRYGQLTWNGLQWSFKYSLEFKKQSDFSPLIDFPNIEKEYTSNQLWPFFLHRIPAIDRPEIQKVLVKSEVDPKDIVGLLRLFGERNISNPYILVSA